MPPFETGRMNHLGQVFPLAALVGQDRMKLALLLLAVDPDLGGVLLVGQKGTAKSTAVRGLIELLPDISTTGCPFNCAPEDRALMCSECRSKSAKGGSVPGLLRPTPFLTLPLGATEDRVAGGLDLELSARSGRPILKPGLLGQANRGFLYLDEVNLLETFLSHLLLDAVESGVLRVEREGISTWHPSRAALIGTMNPEEGRLGPQLTDRFALVVRVNGEPDPAVRKEIVRRRLAYESDPAGFSQTWAKETAELSRRLLAARQRLAGIELTDTGRGLISELAGQYRVSGHRGDLALARAARALAAWENRFQVTEKEVLEAADLALDFRRTQEIKKRTPVIAVKLKTGPGRGEPRVYVAPSSKEIPPQAQAGEDRRGSAAVHIYQPNQVFDILTPAVRREYGPKEKSGRRSARKTNAARGRYYRSSAERLGRPLALDATVRAAAPHQPSRRGSPDHGLVIKEHDLREKVYRQKTGRLILFVVDASGSVGSLERMSEAKAAVLSLLAEAYLKRDRVGLIAFNHNKAEVLLPPTNSVDLASRLLEDLPTGGKTPLSAALVSVQKVLRAETARDPGLTPLVVLMTDGRPNVPLVPGNDPWREALSMASLLAKDGRWRFILVDTDRGHYSDYKCTRDLARNLGAPRLTLENLRRGELEAWLEQVV